MAYRLKIASFTFFVPLLLGLVPLLLAPAARAQSEIDVERPTGRLGWLTRPYRASHVPEIRLTNSPRMNELIRAGNGPSRKQQQ